MRKLYLSLLTIIILAIFIGGVNKTYALDEFYDWASGYKFRTDVDTQAPPDGSMDYNDYFKNEKIVGGTVYQAIGDLYAEWGVHKGNWDATFPACRDYELYCTHEGEHRGPIEFSYTCTGDVPYNLNIDTSLEDFVGGDTMYGTWSMLFNFFPPVLDEDNCSEFGRCFVGNAYIQDTKAQKEKIPGRLWAIGEKLAGKLTREGLESSDWNGVKGPVQGPGDVFFFDQVRAMTQPPKDKGYGYNNPYLVGDPIIGTALTGECDGQLFASQLPDLVAKSVNPQAEIDINEVIGNGNLDASMGVYAKIQEETGIPCEILAGIHYVEDANDPNGSLWNGGGPPVGGSLESDARVTAQKLLTNLGGRTDLSSYTYAITQHNGQGNRNCYSLDLFYCFNSQYIPTGWAGCSSPTPEYGDLWDSPYALAFVDPAHEGMYLIYKYDGDVCRENKDCSCYFQPPTLKLGSGVLAFARAFYENYHK